MSNKPISPPTISPVDPVAKPVAATVNRWAFAALVGGNLALSLTAMVVRFGYRKVMTTGLVLVALSMLLLARIELETPLWGLLIVFFLFGFGMGTAGAALGTVGGQAVSAAMALWFFFGQRRRPYRIRWADLRPRWAVAREVLAALKEAHG